jgi:hypothetical protein
LYISDPETAFSRKKRIQPLAISSGRRFSPVYIRCQHKSQDFAGTTRRFSARAEGFAAFENHFVREKKVKTALENGPAPEIGTAS